VPNAFESLISVDNFSGYFKVALTSIYELRSLLSTLTASLFERWRILVPSLF
jgi:hypothetical protein